MARAAAPASAAPAMSSRRPASPGQFEQPYGPMGPPTLFTIPVLRSMKTYGLTHEQLAMVSVVQREWAAKNPRATFKTPITVEDVLISRIIAYPFVTRTQYPGIRFLPTEPFGRRSGNGRIGALLPIPAA
jgi:acetyl-CoA acetyltransferase